MDKSNLNLVSRRRFLAASTFFLSGALLDYNLSFGTSNSSLLGKEALVFHHFPSALHAFLWRNWNLVPFERLAKVVQAKSSDLLPIAKALGLPKPAGVSKDQLDRSYLTIIRRNWHLLPREQLLELLDWTDEKLNFTLLEDDFFYIKLGSIKPVCQPVRFIDVPSNSVKASKWIREVLQEEFPNGVPPQEQPLFQFVHELSTPPAKGIAPINRPENSFSPRFAYSYFALFGDPLLDPAIDPLPNGYLARMVHAGMDSTWIHIVLSKLTPFPWDKSVSEHWERRLENLKKLVIRAKSQGIGIYLYLNEPRNLPLRFFDTHPHLKGVTNGNHAALCTSSLTVQQYIVESLARITEVIPDVAGFFSITASENPSNCWSHGRGAECSRCGNRAPSEVIAELNNLYQQGIRQGIRNYEQKSRKLIKNPPQLIVWDWGWHNSWADEIIRTLPEQSSLMSVSEWDLSIDRGGIRNGVGEYSISAIGPGPRALKNWKTARDRNLKIIAKIQAGNTWEIAAVPYIPAMENVAIHAANLRDAEIEGIMLGWTLGGYPSPNLEVVAAIGNDKSLTPDKAMELVANRRYGIAGQFVVEAWKQFSKAFSEYPFGSGLYFAPLQVGPSNLLWSAPTGYAATMVGIPYDQLQSWVGNYPVEVFIKQMEKVADGFERGLLNLRNNSGSLSLSNDQYLALEGECNVAETVAIHIRSVVHQAHFISFRNYLEIEKDPLKRQAIISELEKILKDEIALAKRMHILQSKDSRLGFEASNHYFYVPGDLIEKVLNCRYLIDNWLGKLKR